MYIKSVGRLFVSGMKAKKQWFDKVKSSMKTFLSASRLNTAVAARAAKLRAMLADIGRTIDRMLLPVMAKLCRAEWSMQMILATGGLMEYIGFPGGIKETGTWMKALVPCLDDYCAAQNQPFYSQRYMQQYVCELWRWKWQVGHLCHWVNMCVHVATYFVTLGT